MSNYVARELVITGVSERVGLFGRECVLVFEDLKSGYHYTSTVDAAIAPKVGDTVEYVCYLSDCCHFRLRTGHILNCVSPCSVKRDERGAIVPDAVISRWYVGCILPGRKFSLQEKLTGSRLSTLKIGQKEAALRTGDYIDIYTYPDGKEEWQLVN